MLKNGLIFSTVFLLTSFGGFCLTHPGTVTHTDVQVKTDLKNLEKKDPQSEYRLSKDEEIAIIRNMDHAYEEIPLNGDQRKEIIENTLSIVDSMKNRKKGNIDHYLNPRSQKYLLSSFGQKLGALVLNFLDPESFYDLFFKLNGFLRVDPSKKEMVGAHGFGKVNEHGILELSGAFSLAGPRIEYLVRALQFTCRREKNKKMCSWDKVEPVSVTEELLNTPFNVAAGVVEKELLVCGKSTDEKNCIKWDIFQKHIKGCRFEHILGCIENTDENTKAQNTGKENTRDLMNDLLRKVYRHEKEKIAKLMIEDEKSLVNYLPNSHPEWSIMRFKDEDEFISDQNVQSNLHWVILLFELIRRDLYHAQEYRDKNKVKSFVSGALLDVAHRFSKLKMLMEANSVKEAAKERVGYGVSYTMGKILKKMIDTADKDGKKEIKEEDPENIAKFEELKENLDQVNFDRLESLPKTSKRKHDEEQGNQPEKKKTENEKKEEEQN
jgi:hypothetical protein